MKKVVIVGAGAGGVFCAANLDGRNAKVVVLEAAHRPMLKLLQTGGGRCNFTNERIDTEKPEEFYPRGARFLRKPLKRFGAKNAAEFFGSLKVASKTEDEGRVFPKSDDANSIADALMKAALKNGTEFIFGARVCGISKNESSFTVEYESNGKQSVEADAVVFAGGGRWNGGVQKSLETMGVEFAPPMPSLFALETAEAESALWRGLCGTSLPDTILTAFPNDKSAKITARGALLFAHFGISGPAALKLSSFGAPAFFEKKYEFPVSANLIPSFDFATRTQIVLAAREGFAKKKIKNTPLFGLTQKLWDFAIELAKCDGEKIWANLPKKDETALLGALTECPIHCRGKSAHKGEFVICGGVECAQINFATMSLKTEPNLHFVGECLNIDAITGGFNLQAAWTTAKICADSLQETHK